MLSAKISLEDSAGRIERLFSLEDKALSNGRGEYTVSRSGNNLEIAVTAQDSVALRSILTSVTRVLTVDEKVSKVLEDE